MIGGSGIFGIEGTSACAQRWLIVKLGKATLLSFFEKVPDEKLPLAFVEGEEEENVTLVDGELVVSTSVDKAYVERMLDHQTVNVWLNDVNLNRVTNLGNDLVPAIDYKLLPEDALNFIEDCQYMNEHSTIKRNPIFSRDILDRFSSQGAAILLADANSPLSKKVAKKVLAKNKKAQTPMLLPATINEKGLLVFIEKTKEKFSHYEKLTDAIMKSGKFYRIVPDKRSFSENYKKQKPQLIILGYQEDSPNAMSLYIYLKKIDPFAKILEINQDYIERNEKILSEKIVEAYQSSYDSIVEKSKQNKMKLNATLEEEIKSQILELQDNYQAVNHVRIAYRIEKLSTNFDVLIVSKMLEKVRMSQAR